MSNDMDARIARANSLHIAYEAGFWAWLRRTAELSDRIHDGGNEKFMNNSEKNQSL